MKRMTVCVGLILMAGCVTPTDPNALPDGAEWLVPLPVEYVEWWAETERCAGTTGDFASVRWAIYPDRFFVPGTRNSGVAHIDTRMVELAGRYRLNAPTVRHEMLHLLLQTAEHPTEYFALRCAELVAH